MKFDKWNGIGRQSCALFALEFHPFERHDCRSGCIIKATNLDIVIEFIWGWNMTRGVLLREGQTWSSNSRECSAGELHFLWTLASETLKEAAA
jgi:hypothetical protein